MWKFIGPLLTFLLRGNYFYFDKRNPELAVIKKKNKSQDSISALIYLGLILPLLIWFMTGYFLLVGKVTVSKWIGALIFTLCSLPFYFIARRRVKQIDFYSDTNHIKFSKRDRRLYLLIVVALVSAFFLSIICSVIMVRNMLYG